MACGANREGPKAYLLHLSRRVAVGDDVVLRTYSLDDVVYAPTGFFLSYTAWRKNISGIAKGPLPFFWGVSKSA